MSSRNHFTELLKGIDIEPSLFIERERLVFGKKLGEGAFGAVHVCDVKGWETEKVVVKRVLPHKLKADDAVMLCNEIILSAILNHPNTVKFLGLCAQPKEVCLLSERCDDGSLERELDDHKIRPLAAESQVIDRMHQMASGMAHVHSLGYMHRDLKPANILMHGSLLKIADFGLARRIPSSPALLTAETGSYRWMAPEVMRHEAYDERCDVYSFALLSWASLTHTPPFAELTPVEAAFAVAKKSARPAIPPQYGTPIRDLIERCWAQQLEKRPSFEEVLVSIDKLRGARATQAPADACAGPPAVEPLLELNGEVQLMPANGTWSSNRAKPKRLLEDAGSGREAKIASPVLRPLINRDPSISSSLSGLQMKVSEEDAQQAKSSA